MCAKLTAPRRELSLNALRAFEAMARTGGATAAAAELGVTHGAVSRQVKALERALGVPLFTGPKHRLELTAAGRDLLRPLTLAFDQIAHAVAAARAPDGPLRLAVHPSLSVKWLIPRLPRLAEAEPALALELTELPARAKRQRHAHGALRVMSRAEQAGLPCHRVMPNAVGPVLSPALLDRHRGVVLAAPRLASATHLQGWPDWAQAAGVAVPDGPVRSFAHLHFAFDAAIAGLGAMVAPWPLVADDLAAGRLVAPCGFVPDDSDFVLIPAPGEESRQLRALLRWLRREAEAMDPAPGAKSTATL